MKSAVHRLHAIRLAILGLCLGFSACDRPPDAQAALAEAQGLMAENQPEAAEGVLREALDAGVANPDLSLQLAELQMNRGDAVSAIETLESGARLFSKDLRLATLLGLYLVENGQFERADAVLSPVLEHRQDARVHFYRGRARERLDGATGPLEDYRAAVELAPGWSSPHYRLAQLLEANGQSDVAAFHRSEFHRLRKIEEQIERLEGVLLTNRVDPELWLQLTQAYIRQGDMPKAAASLESALVDNPSSADLNAYYGDILLPLGREAEARQAYQRALSLDESRPLTWLKLGDLDYSHQEIASAEFAYRRALAVATDFWPAMNNLAWLLLDQGKNRDEAIALATRASEIHPLDITLDTLAMAHLVNGNLVQSKEIIDRVMEMSPENPEFQEHRDRIHKSQTGP